MAAKLSASTLSSTLSLFSLPMNVQSRRLLLMDTVGRCRSPSDRYNGRRGNDSICEHCEKWSQSLKVSVLMQPDAKNSHHVLERHLSFRLFLPFLFLLL